MYIFFKVIVKLDVDAGRFVRREVYEVARVLPRSAVMESGRVLKRSAKNQNFSIIRCFSWILFVTTACLYQPGSSPLA